jgi:type IV secretory pathway VirB10-like protein
MVKKEKCFSLPNGKVVCSKSKGAKKNYDDEKVKCSKRKGTWRKVPCKGGAKKTEKKPAKKPATKVASKPKPPVSKKPKQPAPKPAPKPAPNPKPPVSKRPESPPSTTSTTAPLPTMFKPNKWLKIEEDTFIKLTNGRKGLIVVKRGDNRYKKYKGVLEQYKEKGKKAKESFNWKERIKSGQFKGKFRSMTSEYINKVSTPSSDILKMLKPI